jgi:hypothetical protein
LEFCSGLGLLSRVTAPIRKLLSKTAARGSSVVRRRTQSGFIVVQVALTFVFLLGAGLLFRTIRHLWNVNPGFVTNNVITFRPRSRLQ